MNIFYLDHDPVLCAQYHCDKHVVKMILETAQIMSTVAYNLVDADSDLLYKPTHQSHPCTLWANESWSNCLYLYLLGCNLGAEYTLRYGKVHKSVQVIHEAWKCLGQGGFVSLPATPPAQAMPEHCRVPDDPVRAYRNYYITEKARMLSYKKRGAPSWMVS